VRAVSLALLLTACRFGFDPSEVVPACVPERQVTAIDIGERFGCAQLADSTLACWGDGGEGQLGTGDFAAHEPVAPIGLGAVDAFALGNAHACAVQAGVVRCWGRNHNSQLGINNATYQSMPVAIGGLTNVASLAAGGMTTCAVTTTGALWCWGANNGFGSGAFNVPRQVLGLPPIAQVAISTNDLIFSATHACAVATDGSVWCWGFNNRSQLGVTGMMNSATPVRAMLASPAQQVAIGDYVTCALLATGEVMCWGGGEEGRLGDGTEVIARAEPALVGGLSDVVGLSAHAGTVCARTTAGELYCWGQNHAGELVGHEGMFAVAPVKLPFTNVRAIGVGAQHACALDDDVVYCWGRDRTDRQRPTAAATVALTDVDDLRAAGGRTCAHRTDDTIFCWGDNALGQLGDGTRVDRAAPVAVLGGARSVATGAMHTCAIAAGGGVHCWGYDDAAQVSGALSYTPVLEPTPVTGLGEPIVALAAGATHTCARSTANTIWCWGWNAEGQLGMPSIMAESPPARSNLPASAELATGSEHTCVIDASSTLICIGRNNENQIDAMASDAYVPRPALANVSRASMQGRSTCAISGATVFCWGDNTYGQLGHGDHVNRLVPTSTITGAIDIVAGRRHACMRGAGGQVMCWGTNDDGQLGDGTLASSTAPVVASALANATQLVLGDRHTCALVEGNVVCVGAGDRGQLGNGGTVRDPKPSAASISCP
jgi:alpha-tubulin suppressor-like RCC1 family protein